VVRQLSNWDRMSRCRNKVSGGKNVDVSDVGALAGLVIVAGVSTELRRRTPMHQPL